LHNKQGVRHAFQSRVFAVAEALPKQFGHVAFKKCVLYENTAGERIEDLLYSLSRKRATNIICYFTPPHHKLLPA
jgi:hypothetical protein